MSRNDDNLPAHAKYAPSAMNRIIECPMSVELCEKAPIPPTSSFAEEGTIAHAHAEEALLTIGESLDEVPEGEMRDAVQIYFQHCNTLIEFDDDYIEYGIEARAVVDEELFGTVDFWVLDSSRHLHIVDFKYGSGVAVQPKNNKQLLTYAGLVLMDDEIPITELDVESVILTIIQPRAGGEPVRTAEHGVQEVIEHMEIVDAAINTAKMPTPPGRMGDHCRWCSAKIICPVIQAAEQGVKNWKERDIPPGELNQLLRDAQVIEAKIKDLFSYAHSMLEEGQNIPGWKLVPKRAMAKWVDEDKLLAWAKREGKLSKLYQKKLITPAQASKIINDDSLNRFIEKKSSGTNLKPTEDPTEQVQSLGDAFEAIGSLH